MRARGSPSLSPRKRAQTPTKLKFTGVLITWHGACEQSGDDPTLTLSSMSEMSREPGSNPNDNTSKSPHSAEYRHRLLTKLDCLIAVLEVAIGKISKSLNSGDTNRDRLLRIKSNLENTLAICRRAKETLEAKLREDDSAGRREQRALARRPKESISFRCYVELSSIDEFRKFKDLPAITHEDIQETDVDDLMRKLSEYA